MAVAARLIPVMGTIGMRTFPGQESRRWNEAYER